MPVIFSRHTVEAKERATQKTRRALRERADEGDRAGREMNLAVVVGDTLRSVSESVRESVSV